MKTNHKDELISLQIAFDVARAVRRNTKTGKAFSIAQFADEYLQQSPSMISEIFSGSAKSEPVLKAVARFILDTKISGAQCDEFKALARSVLER